MIKAEQLTVKFEKTGFLCDLNFALTQNGVYCMTGPSGIGKSTLLNAIAGLVPYSGTIRTEGKISYLFQEDRLLPWMNALENVRLVLKEHFERAEYYIGKFGLTEAADKMPEELSGGCGGDALWPDVSPMTAIFFCLTNRSVDLITKMPILCVKKSRPWQRSVLFFLLRMIPKTLESLKQAT